MESAKPLNRATSSVFPRLVATGLAVVGFAVTAVASDGVLEINQTCATQTGCFSGDTAAFPVLIDGTAGRSYRLTSDLVVPNENTDGIAIASSDISIDLNGFSIIRNTCQGVGHVNCTPTSGTGSGIEVVDLVMNRGIAVKNGAVTGMGNYGVLLGDQASVTNLRVRWNRLDGIHVKIGSSVAGNTTYQNGGDGLFAGRGSTISGNTAFDNGGDGIEGDAGCTVFGNAAYSNGDATSPTLDDGIECGGGCAVHGNTVRLNSGYGLNLGTYSAYTDNVVTVNVTGTVFGLGSANSLGGNFCQGTGTGSLSCP